MIESLLHSHLILLGIVLGIFHAFEVDHVAAVGAMTARVTNTRRAAFLGAFWGLGHALSLILLCLVFLGFKLSAHTGLSAALETAVGFVLLFLGYDAIQKAQSGAFHVHAHDHGDGLVHTHAHTHPHGGSSHTSFLVGSLHGLAGSGALLILALSATQSFMDGMRFVMSFGLGSILGMALFGAGVGFFMQYLEGFSSYARFARLGTGIVSAIVGISLVVTTVLPLI